MEKFLKQPSDVGACNTVSEKRYNVNIFIGKMPICFLAFQGKILLTAN